MSKRYFLDQDNNGHWYLIPCDRVNEWDNWNESSKEMGFDEGQFDECRIAGAPRWVTFTDPVDTIS